ncbi:hypothetical protein HYPDE_38608 [Hyphomicrobium denitrificans 1NES1]|uniref:Uncharacterized protein n=1 Tax=Hyphomicrobium denitrificans 1NES1 TaxID=670307 RepID=N0BFZ4_9HYPH|nr:hypothetical protein HYPDE_38608 [Hyphomicrobium denitrificans 1NES1]
MPRSRWRCSRNWVDQTLSRRSPRPVMRARRICKSTQLSLIIVPVLSVGLSGHAGEITRYSSQHRERRTLHFNKV